MTNQRRKTNLDSVLRDDRRDDRQQRVMRAFWTSSKPLPGAAAGARVLELAAYADANALRPR